MFANSSNADPTRRWSVSHPNEPSVCSSSSTATCRIFRKPHRSVTAALRHAEGKYAPVAKLRPPVRTDVLRGIDQDGRRRIPGSVDFLASSARDMECVQLQHVLRITWQIALSAFTLGT